MNSRATSPEKKMCGGFVAEGGSFLVNSRATPARKDAPCFVAEEEEDQGTSGDHFGGQ